MLAKRVLKNVIYNSSSILISNIAGVIVSIYLARVLRSELFGIYSLAISVAFLLLTFTDLGLNTTIVRYASHAYGAGSKELVRGYVRNLGKIKLALSAAIALFLLLAAELLAENIFHKPILATPLKITAAYVFFFSLLGFVNSIFNAFNDFSANFVRAIVYELSRVALIFLFVSAGLAVVGALLGFVIATILALATLVTLLIFRYGSWILGKAEKIEWRRVLRFSGYLTLGSVTWVVFAYVDSIMIGILLPANAVGYYRAAYNIVGAVAGLVSVPAVMFPVFVQLEGKDLERAFDRVFKYSAILAFPAAFGLIAIGKPLVEVVYGAEYSAAVPVLCVLSLLILRSALGFWGPIFNAKERPEYPVYASLFAMLLNVVLNYVMILRLGITGAAAATVISNAALWLTLGAASRKFFGIFPRFADISKPLAAAALMYFVISQIKPGTLAEGMLVIVFGAAVYFLALLMLRGLGREDIEYFLGMLKG